jgi:hypothetical protein
LIPDDIHPNGADAPIPAVRQLTPEKTSDFRGNRCWVGGRGDALGPLRLGFFDCRGNLKFSQVLDTEIAISPLSLAIVVRRKPIRIMRAA